MRQFAWWLVFACILSAGGCVGATLTGNDPAFIVCVGVYCVGMLGLMLLLVAVALGVVR